MSSNSTSSKKSGLIAGVVVLVVCGVFASGVGIFAVVGLFGGAVSMMGGAVSGALANQQSETNKKASTCLAPSSNGTFTQVTADQTANVRTIIGVAKGLGIDQNGQIIGVMTGKQESDLGKDPSAVKPNSDGDAGMFQQRQYPGWYGSLEMVNDPAYASTAFFQGVQGASADDWGSVGGSKWHLPGLLDIDNWETMDKGAAAQKVQRSDYPREYSKHESMATSLVQANSDAPSIAPVTASSGGSGGAQATTTPDPNAAASAATATGFNTPMKEGTYTLTSGFGPRSSPGGVGSTNHKGQDFGAPQGTPIYATANGTVAAAGAKSGMGNWVVIDHTVNGTKYSSVYGHMPLSSISVTVGQAVTSGQQIATVGSEGNSTGPHLHFEIWDGGRLTGGTAVDPMKVLSGSYQGSGNTGSGGGATDAQCGATSSAGTLNVTGLPGTAIEAGKQYLGQDYAWAGGDINGPTKGSGSGRGAHLVGFDCSGLVQYMFYQATGYTFPHSSRQQYQQTKGNTVGRPGEGFTNLQPGDLLFWGPSPGGIHHVAMYVGNGQVIEAYGPSVSINQLTAFRIGGDYFAATRPNYGG